MFEFQGGIKYPISNPPSSLPGRVAHKSKSHDCASQNAGQYHEGGGYDGDYSDFIIRIVRGIHVGLSCFGGLFAHYTPPANEKLDLKDYLVVFEIMSA